MATVLERRPDAEVDFTNDVADVSAALTGEEHEATLLSMAAVVGRVMTTEELLALLRASAEQKEPA